MKAGTALLAAAAALATSACSSHHSVPPTRAPAASVTNATTATTTPAAAAPSTTTATTGQDPLAGASTSAVSVPARSPRALLSAVRVAHQPGLDRVVFEFERDQVPGYSVAYVDRPIREAGSGRAVEVTGGAVLEVVMADASAADLSSEGVRRTYLGPPRVRGEATTTLREAVSAGDFEGRLRWVIGVDRRTGFRVSTLAGPPRLVVDLRAP